MGAGRLHDISFKRCHTLWPGAKLQDALFQQDGIEWQVPRACGVGSPDRLRWIPPRALASFGFGRGEIFWWGQRQSWVFLRLGPWDTLGQSGLHRIDYMSSQLVYDVFCHWLQTSCRQDVVMLQELHWGCGREDNSWRIPGWTFFISADPQRRFTGVGTVISARVLAQATTSHWTWIPGRLLQVKCCTPRVNVDFICGYQAVWQEGKAAQSASMRDEFWVKLGSSPRTSLQEALARAEVPPDLQHAILQLHENCRYTVSHKGKQVASLTSPEWAKKSMSLFADDSHLSWTVRTIDDLKFVLRSSFDCLEVLRPDGSGSTVAYAKKFARRGRRRLGNLGQWQEAVGSSQSGEPETATPSTPAPDVATQNLLLKSLVRHEEELTRVRPDAGFVAFIDTTELGCLGMLKQVAGNWHELSQGKVKKSLRVMLAMALFRDLKERAEQTLADPERLEKCHTVGWLQRTETALDPAWAFHVWDPSFKKQVATDRVMKHSEAMKLLDLLILNLPKEQVLTRFKSVRPLADSHDTEVVPFLISVGLCGESCQKCFDALLALSGCAITKLQGLRSRQERIQKTPLSKTVEEAYQATSYSATGPAEERLAQPDEPGRLSGQAASRETRLVPRQGLGLPRARLRNGSNVCYINAVARLAWRALCGIGGMPWPTQGPLSHLMRLHPAGEASASLQSLIDACGYQHAPQALHAHSVVVFLMLCRYDESGAKCTRQVRVRPGDTLALPIFSEPTGLDVRHESFTVVVVVFHLGQRVTEGHYLTLIGNEILAIARRILPAHRVQLMLEYADLLEVSLDAQELVKFPAPCDHQSDQHSAAELQAERLLNTAVMELMGPDFTCTSFSINLDDEVEPHRDMCNAPAPSVLLGLTCHAGGGFWYESEHGHHFLETPAGFLSGLEVGTACRAWTFSSRLMTHAALPASFGRRMVLLAYTTANHHRATPEHRELLQRAGFVMPSPDNLDL
ncbi:unnamed protein product [Symbiodinium sp. CCMP2592]|nr:unnamed protein product [Symbiodinium sp. CCMP2592]